MLSQNQVKHITSLKVKKFREEHHQFIAEGSKLVAELVAGRYSVAGIYADAGWIVENIALVRKKEIPVYETMPREMDRISALSTPSQVLAVVNIPEPLAIGDDPAAASLILALDDIRDPGNFGTIIRIADWFGIDTILSSENCVDVYNPKVVQATMGSLNRVNVIACALAGVLSTLSGPVGRIPVYGTFLDGGSIYEQTLTGNGIIVIGNESRGISQELVPFITRKLLIPAYGTSAEGKAESLNASIATALVCAEFRRNKRTFVI